MMAVWEDSAQWVVQGERQLFLRANDKMPTEATESLDRIVEWLDED